MCQFYKILVSPEDPITGLGPVKTSIKRAYPYTVKGCVYLTTNKRIAETRGEK